MTRDEYRNQLAADGERMAVLAEGDLTAPVPTCPGWTLKDLVEHTGFVHRWQTAALREDTDGFPDPTTWQIPPTDGEPWSAWFREGLAAALEVHGSVTPDEHRWTWYEPDQSAGWLQRRMAQETIVHRVDAELAAGVPVTPVDPAMAVDGIDEMFDVFLPASGPQPVGGTGETVRLAPTDATVSWRLTLRSDTVEVERERAGPTDATVRASALDLLLYIWGREPLGAVDVEGDRAAERKLFAAAAYQGDDAD